MVVTFNVFNNSFWICPDEIFKLKKMIKAKFNIRIGS